MKKSTIIKQVLLLSLFLFLPFSFAADTISPISQNKTIEAIVTGKPISDYDYSNIKTSINNILYKNKNLDKTKYGIAVYSTKLNKWIYEHNANLLLVPASNTKLFTTFTSYSTLGKDFHIATNIYIDGVIKDNVLIGDLYLVGGGDPIFNINDIETIVDAIKQYGIKKIEGNIYGDNSFFDDVTDRYKYSGDQDEVQAVPPITALSIEKNIVTIIVTSGKIPGKSVNVNFRPASSAFTTSISAKVASNSEETDLFDDLTENDETDENAILNLAGDSKPILVAAKKKNVRKKSSRKKRNVPSIQITTSMLENGKQCFYVKGSLQRNRTYTYQYYIKDPAFVATSALKDRLITAGITVTGKAATKTLDTNAENKKLIYTFSRNINDIIVPTNKFSDNYLAEALFKLNGAVNGHKEDCAVSSRIANKETLKKFNLAIPENFLLNDGSGLSRRNTITTKLLASLLIAANNSTFAHNLDSSLSIAGIDGTLQKRMKQSNAENNLRAKTGTLRNVSSLAGYINTKLGDTLVFAFIFNGPNVGAYKSIENELGIVLSNY